MNSISGADSTLKGRGSATRLAHRFEATQREAFDDGWPSAEADEACHRPPATTVTLEDARSALSHNDSPDMHFTQGVSSFSVQ